MVRAQLLLPVRQRRLHPRVLRRRRGQARGQTLRGRPRHQEGHPLQDDHALLPLEVGGQRHSLKPSNPVERLYILQCC